MAVFITLYSTDADFALLTQVHIVRGPVQLFCLMAVPILLRVHWPEYRRNALTRSLALGVTTVRCSSLSSA